MTEELKKSAGLSYLFSFSRTFYFNARGTKETNRIICTTGFSSYNISLWA